MLTDEHTNDLFRSAAEHAARHHIDPGGNV